MIEKKTKERKGGSGIFQCFERLMITKIRVKKLTKVKNNIREKVISYNKIYSINSFTFKKERENELEICTINTIIIISINSMNDGITTDY